MPCYAFDRVVADKNLDDFRVHGSSFIEKENYELNSLKGFDARQSCGNLY
jgi:hypothetical protein